MLNQFSVHLMSDIESWLIAASTFCQNRDNTNHASLYPVLVILSRLYPSTMDGVDTVLSMEMFLPYVIR